MQSSRKPLAVAYYRVSTQKQGQSGLGLADQERLVTALCEARGLKVVGSFTEIESGKNDARPVLAQALEVARRKGGILVIATLSRLGRDVHFISGLMKTGVPFAAADAPDDEPFILHMKASFAEEEARKISTRTKAALAVAKARGVQLGKPENMTAEGRARGSAVMKARGATNDVGLSKDVLRLRDAGNSLRSIAAEVGVSLATVQRILARHA